MSIAREAEQLSVRVLKGFLFYAKEEDMRKQLQSEGISAEVVDLAIKKARGTYSRMTE